MRWHRWLALAVMAFGLSGAALAADIKLNTAADFLAESLVRSASMTRASEQALKRAESKKVRELARKVIDQQKAFRPALVRLAVVNYVPVRFNELRGEDTSDKALSGRKGAAFDRAYLKLVIEQLDGWADLTRRCAEDGLPAERSLAVRLLPGLRQRLQEARRLEAAAR